MKRLLPCALLALVLAACGGGGSSPIPAPKPTPTTTPQTLSVRISWTGLGHSSGTTTQSLRTMDSVSSEPVEMAIAPPCQMGSLGCNSINANANFSGASAQVEVTDSNGNIVVEPTPAVSLASPVAAVTPEPLPTPATTPQPNDYNLHATSKDKTATTLTATYSSSLSASINLHEYLFAGFEYPTVSDQDAAVGYILDASGFLDPQANSTNADVYIAKDTDGSVKLFAPGGIQVLGATQPIGTLSSALPFTSSGTSVLISSLTTNPVVVIKANLGYIAFKFGVTQCTYKTTASTCDASAMTGAIYNTAGTSGAFN